LPLVIVVLLEIAAMGRARIIFAAILFYGGYATSTGEKRRRTSLRRRHWIRQAIPLLAGAAILIVGAELVRSSRAAVENLPSTTPALQKLRSSTFITPSIYLYLTVDHGVFNQYLKRDDEHTPWGSNTLAPLYRFASKFGFDTEVPVYQRVYNTPVGANTGSYLRELHADFGLPGVFIFPYVLGLGVTSVWFRFRQKKRYVDLMFLTYLLLVVMFSLFYPATRAGDWFIGLMVGCAIGYFLDWRLVGWNETKSAEASANA